MALNIPNLSQASGLISNLTGGARLPGLGGITGNLAGRALDNLPGGLGNVAGSLLGGLIGGQMLGSIGSVVFQVSQFSVRTWETIDRKTEANFSDHAVIGQKPVSEYIGATLDTLEFTITLNGSLGIDPLTEAENLRAMILAGEPQQVVLAGKNLGPFTIRSMEEEWRYTRNGRPLIIEVTLKITEYIDTVPTEAQAKQRDEELRRGDTGLGGPERLPGSGEPIQSRSLEAAHYDPSTGFLTGGGSSGGGGGDFNYDLED